MAKALHLAKVTGATLIIAKLDRLSRNAAFLLILAVAEKWMSDDPAYNLFSLSGKNCNNFAAEVATAIGLSLPSHPPGGTLPIN